MLLPIQKINPDATLPRSIRDGDAALDLYSSEDILIPFNERRVVSTGIAMSIPPGYVGLVWDRSGLAARNGLTMLGGVIDSNYRGEIKVIIHNLGVESFQVEKGMRIAQILIQPTIQPEILEVHNLNETVRGADGFGSSGLK